MHFNGIVINHLLVARLRNGRFVLRVKLNYGHLGIPVLAVEHSYTVDGTALFKMLDKTKMKKKKKKKRRLYMTEELSHSMLGDVVR